MRKFEIIKGYEEDAKMPKRATKFSAGYDFVAIEDVYVPSLFTVESTNMSKERINFIEEAWNNEAIDYATYMDRMHQEVKNMLEYSENYHPVIVKTGIKAQFPENEALLLLNRSSNPKRGLFLANGIGLIDSDYYNNEDNEGHIMFQFINLSQDDYMIEAGDKIGQGVFIEFKTVDNDDSDGERSGGFGSTGDK